MLEKKIEAHLVARVKAVGGTAYKFTSPSRRSVPDRLCLFPGGLTVFVECKRPGGKPTEAQAREHARIRALGHVVWIVDTLEGADALVATYGRAPQ